MTNEFKTYPKVFALDSNENEGILTPGLELWITEKVDGTNFRFMLRDGGIVYGTHHTDLGYLNQIPKTHMHRVLAEIIESKVPASDLREGFVYFMEGFGGVIKHTIAYPRPASLIGVDIWMWVTAPAFQGEEVRGRFMQHGLVKTEFERLGFETVPLLYRGKDQWKPEALAALVAKSAFYEGQMEGIVVKAYNDVNKYGRQMMAKVVTEEFKEANKAVFGSPTGGSKKVYVEPGLVEAYCPDARVRKKFHELIESGAERSMKLVPVLGKLVYDDMWEECWRDFAYLAVRVDMKDLRNLVYAKVAKMLKSLLEAEPPTEGLNSGDALLVSRKRA